MLPRSHGLFAIALLVGCPPPDSKDLLYEPVPLEAHEVKVAADAEGDPKHPAHVAVYLQRGILQLRGGASHTLEGVATGAQGDLPPRLDLMQDRVALTQAAVGGSPPRGDAKFMLALGATPTALELDTGQGEAQTIDLGGVPLVRGRFHTATGHLTMDWSAPNPLPSGALSFETEGGYVEVSHLGRSGASKVDVTNVAGLVRLDVGDMAGAGPIDVHANVTSGRFILRTPKDLPVLVSVEAPDGVVAPTGFRPGDAPGSFVSGPAGASPRVTAHVRSQSGHVDLKAE